MTKVLAINASPRRDGNTAKMLKRALEGAAAKGAEVEFVHTHDLAPFHGCSSCFECKRLGGPSYGKCAMRDGLAPLLEKIDAADAVVFGTPIYMFNAAADFRALYERVAFRYFAYDKDMSRVSLAPRGGIPMALVLTMGMPEANFEQRGLARMVEDITLPLEIAYRTKVRVLSSYDTYQFGDYSKYHASMFDEAAKAKQRDEQFPKDLEQAYQLGASFGEQLSAVN